MRVGNAGFDGAIGMMQEDLILRMASRKTPSGGEGLFAALPAGLGPGSTFFPQFPGVFFVRYRSDVVDR